MKYPSYQRDLWTNIGKWALSYKFNFGLEWTGQSSPKRHRTVSFKQLFLFGSTENDRGKKGNSTQCARALKNISEKPKQCLTIRVVAWDWRKWRNTEPRFRFRYCSEDLNPHCSAARFFSPSSTSFRRYFSSPCNL